MRLQDMSKMGWEVAAIPVTVFMDFWLPNSSLTTAFIPHLLCVLEGAEEKEFSSSPGLFPFC